jgi:hypothetical protein
MHQVKGSYSPCCLHPHLHRLVPASQDSLDIRGSLTPSSCGHSLTHAGFRQHDATLVARETLAFKATQGVDTGALAAEVRGDVTLVNVCGKGGHALGSMSVA